ncbi:MAG TPA: hypothetical protein VLF68_03830, partial [Candidatus Saccharimonadales bacterium]|nr:hypothetical protein [Candidatus Saccharimonadales bacterium]
AEKKSVEIGKDGLTKRAQTTYPKSGDIFMPAIDAVDQARPQQKEKQQAQPLTKEQQVQKEAASKKLQELILRKRELERRAAEDRQKKLEKYQQDLQLQIAKEPLAKWSTERLKKEIEKASKVFSEQDAQGIRAEGGRSSFWKQLVGLQRPVIDELKDRLSEKEKQTAEPKMPGRHEDSDTQELIAKALRERWYSVFTPDELKDPDTRSTIETAIEMGLTPSTITSKGQEKRVALGVVGNALLSDSERIEKAEELLGFSLSESQKKALLKAHYEGRGEAGKNAKTAGVYNYTKEQLARKVKILEEGRFSKDQRRLLIEAGIAATPIEVEYTNEFVARKLEEYNSIVDAGNAQARRAGLGEGRFSVDTREIQRLKNDLNQALAPGGRLADAPPAEKNQVYDLIDRLDAELARQARQSASPAMERGTMYFALTGVDREEIQGDVFAWLNNQIDRLYQLTSRGNELSSPIVQNFQQKFEEATKFLHEIDRDDVVKGFTEQFTARFQLLVTRTTMGHEDIERIQGAVRQLGVKNLLMALSLDDQRVNKMFNELQRKLEDKRLSSPFFHISNEDIYTFNDNIIREQIELRQKGLGSFTEVPDENAEAEIRRAVVTAADALMTSQRQAVIITRGKRLPEEDAAMYLNDPLQGPFWVYAIEDFLTGKYRLYNAEQQRVVARMKLGMADQYLKDHREMGNLTYEQKIQLGERRFRDVIAIADFFSGGYRNEQILGALDDRFAQAYGSKAAGKAASEDFALFIRLKHPDLSDEGNPHREGESGDARDRRVRTEILHKIRRYRPEEIIALYRERAPDELAGLYEQMQAIDPRFRLLNSEDPEHPAAYDDFKRVFGTAMGIIREKGYDFTREGGPVQTDFENLTPQQIRAIGQAVLSAELTDAQYSAEGQKVVNVIKAMKGFLTEGRINALFDDPRFADVFSRTLLVDDAFLPEIEQEETFKYWSHRERSVQTVGELEGGNNNKRFTFDGADGRDIQSVSKRIASNPAGDGLVRSYNDVKDGITAGQGIIKFVRETDLEKKMSGLLPAVDAIKNANGNDDAAQLVRFTLGEYLNLAKQDWIWDVPGVGKLWFRTPSSDLERIVGPHGKPMSRDELRLYVDQIRDL